MGGPSIHRIEDPSLSHMLHGAGIFTYIWVFFWANVGKYTIHGAYGYSMNVNEIGFESRRHPWKLRKS